MVLSDLWYGVEHAVVALPLPRRICHLLRYGLGKGRRDCGGGCYVPPCRAPPVCPSRTMCLFFTISCLPYLPRSHQCTRRATIGGMCSPAELKGLTQ